MKPNEIQELYDQLTDEQKARVRPKIMETLGCSYSTCYRYISGKSKLSIPEREYLINLLQTTKTN